MEWIYLSPHLDDVALSCGGWVWEQTRAGCQVSIWTICAGDPPQGALSAFAESLHARWQTGVDASQRRRSEDLLSCARLGADAVHFWLPDCIYRRAEVRDSERSSAQVVHLYASEEAIFGPIHPAEYPLIQRLGTELAEALPPDAELVCPLTLGGHVDHRLTRAAAELLGRPLWYYADYPYVVNCRDEVEKLSAEGWQVLECAITEQGMQAWEEAVEAHASQLSTFWPDRAAMSAALRSYWAERGGIRLWRPPGDRLAKIAT